MGYCQLGSAPRRYPDKFVIGITWNTVPQQILEGGAAQLDTSDLESLPVVWVNRQKENSSHAMIPTMALKETISDSSVLGSPCLELTDPRLKHMAQWKIVARSLSDVHYLSPETESGITGNSSNRNAIFLLRVTLEFELGAPAG